jgi:enoyl-CoA hydratase
MLVQYALEGRVARLTLDSPHNHNALSTALVEQLHRGFDDAVAAGARVVVLGHTGRTFCAGADLSEAAGRDPGDIAVAGPQSTFALTEARIGVAPSIISLTLLPKLTARAAGRYFLTGEKFGPQEAAGIGLITVAADDVAGTVAALTADIAKASPQGLAASKALTTAGILAGFDAHADALTAQSAELFTSAEAREGMLAFLQKRRPDWA